VFQPYTLRVRPEAREIALEVARYFETLPMRLVVEVHTDDRSWQDSKVAGAHALTREMGLALAQAIAQEAKWSPSRVGVAAFGDSHPIADNATPEGRQKNRRVELVAIPEEPQ
jgi:chemotaxis protein MotB